MNNLKSAPFNKTGIGFITTGAVAGAEVSTTAGGMGLVGRCGAACTAQKTLLGVPR
ncbi:MAG: hypothetical protein KME29_00925 [Calothrix sp. FI2-JRJ7]|nr:hypothetical protein [Calothrix sp. FI2-JRJ7]